MQKRFSMLFSLMVLSVFAVAGQAQAATLTVNTIADELNANGQCSLREAITNINNGATTYSDCAPTGAYGTSDTINIPAGTYTIAIAGIGEELNATGDYDILKSVSIVGAGSGSTTIDGSGIDRVFHVTGAYTVSISGVTVTGGSSAGGAGGCIYNNSGTLTVTNSTISGNTATGFGYGGGIYTRGGTLTVINSTVSGNTSYGGSGILNASTLTLTNSTISGNTTNNNGAGIYNSSMATVTNSTISGNTSTYYGAGIYNQTGGSVTVTDSTISSNTATGGDYNYGGGIYNNDAATVTITNSTISGNTASNISGTGKGGGIFNNGGTATAAVTNSTVSGNTADNGGGISNYGTLTLAGSTLSENIATQGTGWGGGLFNTGNASLTNVTISSNQAKGGAGVWAQPGTITSFESCTIVDNLNIEPSSGAGICGNGGPAISMHNTIFSNNRNNIGSDNCYQAGPSLGYNLSSDSSCLAFSNTGDMQNTDPLLGPLQDNGGPTFTHALLDGSPALNAGDPNNFPETDQRGIARPQGSGPDIGAYEKVGETGPLADLTGNWEEPMTEDCKAKKEGLVCKVKGKFNLRNIGDADAHNVTIRFYLSDNDSYDKGDMALKEDIRKKIVAGKDYKKSYNLTLPVGMSLEGRYIIVYIDADDTTEESNESNNFVVYGEEGQ